MMTSCQIETSCQIAWQCFAGIIQTSNLAKGSKGKLSWMTPGLIRWASLRIRGGSSGGTLAAGFGESRQPGYKLVAGVEGHAVGGWRKFQELLMASG